MSDNASFLGYESASLEEALFSVIPAPTEETASYAKGQALAPSAILDASSQIEDYDEETGISLVDLGVHCLDPEDAPEDDSLKKWVGKQITAALDATTIPVILGGEGTVTLWGISTLLPKVEELSVLHIDAHANLNDPEEGLTHHTVMHEVLNLKPRPRLCQVGVRAISKEGFDRIVDDGESVETFFMSDINKNGNEDWHEDVIRELRSPVYVSLDLTGFDPSIFPNVGNPEPGGLGWWQVLRLLKKVAAKRRIAAFDITELCPKEFDVASDYAAARLTYKLMNYIYAGGKYLEKPEAAAATLGETADA